MNRHIQDSAPEQASASTADKPTAGVRRRLSSSELFGETRELVIEHADEEYRLRITSQGKLILTK